ncbi:uncharacterized protein BKCO1_6700014 [Diplodia corticola]|uniref:Uncharacterized protein n=1 Tax=Diplodia corticola TaxID=236234 RepID=A0A1J9RQ51_9PEZI|nr:uncharacterized protein BKCO1_6700014 [Diplodia corticola]OJD30036.1 hypothetical protein BKCO1_6700014 [Diplodia corticola]
MKVLSTLFLLTAVVAALPQPQESVPSDNDTSIDVFYNGTACNDIACVTLEFPEDLGYTYDNTSSLAENTTDIDTSNPLQRRKGRTDALALAADVLHYYSSQYEEWLKDQTRRRDFTRGLSSKLRDDTGCNIFVCNVGYTVSTPCDYVGNVHLDLKQKDATVVTYSICFANILTFHRQGDGGFENWAWATAGANSCVARSDPAYVDCKYSSPRCEKPDA